MTNKLHGKNIIAGELRDGGTEGARAVNPATGEQLEPKFIHATESEVQQAAEQAEQAQQELLGLGPAHRAGLLRRPGPNQSPCTPRWEASIPCFCYPEHCEIGAWRSPGV